MVQTAKAAASAATEARQEAADSQKEFLKAKAAADKAVEELGDAPQEDTATNEAYEKEESVSGSNL